MDHTISHQPDTSGLKIAVANTIRAFSADDEPANLAWFRPAARLDIDIIVILGNQTTDPPAQSLVRWVMHVLDTGFTDQGRERTLFDVQEFRLGTSVPA